MTKKLFKTFRLDEDDKKKRPKKLKCQKKGKQLNTNTLSVKTGCFLRLKMTVNYFFNTRLYLLFF